MINNPMYDLLEERLKGLRKAIEINRDIIEGNPSSCHTTDGEVKYPYVVIGASAPVDRYNDLLMAMIECIPTEVHKIIWRQHPSLTRYTDNDQERVAFRMRCALLDRDGQVVKPKKYVVAEGESFPRLEDQDDSRT